MERKGLVLFTGCKGESNLSAVKAGGIYKSKVAEGGGQSSHGGYNDLGISVVTSRDPSPFSSDFCTFCFSPLSSSSVCKGSKTDQINFHVSQMVTGKESPL